MIETEQSEISLSVKPSCWSKNNDQ